MKEINFRIIELPTHQVLLTRDFDNEEDDKPLLTLTFFVDDVKISQKLGYGDEKTRDEIFNSLTEEQAQTFLDNIISLMNEEN